MRKANSHNLSRNLCISSMMLALGIILPYATSHGFGIMGTVLLPIHIPVLICGLFCGPLFGGVCGAVLPILSSVLTGMPSLYPMAIIMTCELATYGAVSGALYKKSPLAKSPLGVYPALVGAMLGGRIMYGAAFYLLLLANPGMKALSVWSAVVTGFPGIVVQLAFIPAAVISLERIAGLGEKNVLRSSLNLISQGTAACVVIKKNTIVKTEYRRGISPMISLYDGGYLKDAYVCDKIIGKAAAMIMTLGGVRRCYGITVSRSAVEWLTSHGVRTEYGELVDNIINRTGDGICPMEMTVQNISNEMEALQALRNKVEELNKQK